MDVCCVAQIQLPPPRIRSDDHMGKGGKISDTRVEIWDGRMLKLSLNDWNLTIIDLNLSYIQRQLPEEELSEFSTNHIADPGADPGQIELPNPPHHT